MGSAMPTTTHAPVFASIGTVLIDVFDKSKPSLLHPLTTPPRESPKSHIPSSSIPSTPASSSNTRTPASVTHPSASSTPPTQGISTPQVSLDLSQAEDEENTYEVFGGGALYALVGARMWLSPKQLRTLVNRKTTSLDSGAKPELAPEHEALLRQYGPISIINGDAKGKLEEEVDEAQGMWVLNEGKDKRLARARIKYERDIRLYQHLVKTPHRTFRELRASPLRNSEYLHIAPPFSSEDLHTVLEEISSVNKTLEVQDQWYPKIIFEPTPPSCHAGQREWVERIYSGIEVFSPNHEELLSLYADHPALSSINSNPPEGEEGKMKRQVEVLIQHILDLGIGKDGAGAVAIRCSRHGCVVGTRQGGIRWFPAYYGAEEMGKVKDVTGAGNSFLGGFAAGLHMSHGDPYKAALYGTISSSFTVEQIGLPTIASQPNGDEKWNGQYPLERLRAFEASLQFTS